MTELGGMTTVPDVDAARLAACIDTSIGSGTSSRRMREPHDHSRSSAAAVLWKALCIVMQSDDTLYSSGFIAFAGLTQEVYWHLSSALLGAQELHLSSQQAFPDKTGPIHPRCLARGGGTCTSKDGMDVESKTRDQRAADKR